MLYGGLVSSPLLLYMRDASPHIEPGEYLLARLHASVRACRLLRLPVSLLSVSFSLFFGEHREAFAHRCVLKDHRCVLVLDRVVVLLGLHYVLDLLCLFQLLVQVLEPLLVLLAFLQDGLRGWAAGTVLGEAQVPVLGRLPRWLQP